MFSVYQHWDPLKDCIMGISYPPELYDYISDKKIRDVFYRIAEETEEDYQKYIKLLEKFGVNILRPNIEPLIDRAKYQIKHNLQVPRPTWVMQPRDFGIMIGEEFYLPMSDEYAHIIDHVKKQGNNVITDHRQELTDIEKYYLRNINYTVVEEFRYAAAVNSALTTRVGKDLYVGTWEWFDKNDHRFPDVKRELQLRFPNHRVHVLHTAGHTDGSFCPVVPGLIFSLFHIDNYNETFPGWEVIYLQGESWSKVSSFLNLKQQNEGKWWVPGEELNNEFTNFVEQWLNHWVGYAEESVFDVNMLVIDEKNVVVNSQNELVWEALEKRNITPHVCNFRHRYFWDGGLHCITNDLNRIGVMNDYFPERQ